DGSNHPVQGGPVPLAAAAGGGTVTGAEQTADAGGIATVGSWTLGTTAGPNTLTATSAGLAGSPVTFTATGTAGPAATLAKFAGDNQVGQVGTTLATPQTVLVTDAHGNPVPNVPVTWAAASGGGGSVNPLTSTTNSSGIASTNWTLGTAMTPTDSTQTAQATGVSSALSFTAFTVPGAVSPSQTTVVAAPATITASTGAGASTI